MCEIILYNNCVMQFSISTGQNNKENPLHKSNKKRKQHQTITKYGRKRTLHDFRRSDNAIN